MLEERGEEIEKFRADLFKREYLPKVRAFPGVRELFERIRAAGQTVVLASSGKEDEVEHYEEIAGINGPGPGRDDLRRRGALEAAPRHLRGRPGARSRP